PFAHRRGRGRGVDGEPRNSRHDDGPGAPSGLSVAADLASNSRRLAPDPRSPTPMCASRNRTSAEALVGALAADPADVRRRGCNSRREDADCSEGRTFFQVSRAFADREQYSQLNGSAELSAALAALIRAASMGVSAGFEKAEVHMPKVGRESRDRRQAVIRRERGVRKTA